MVFSSAIPDVKYEPATATAADGQMLIGGVMVDGQDLKPNLKFKVPFGVQGVSLHQAVDGGYVLYEQPIRIWSPHKPFGE